MGRRLVVPLFPLPGTTLFPGVAMPFYVFEPRYRAMIADALDGAGLLGVPMLQPGFEATYEGCPPIVLTFGVGSVEHYLTHKDGTSHIRVLGRWRVRMVEELPVDGFRRARVEIQDEPLLPSTEARAVRADLRRSLVEGAGRMPPDLRRSLDALLLDGGKDLATVVNLLASVLVSSPVLRQDLLEAPDACARARKLAQALLPGRPRTSSRAAPGPEPEEPA